MAGLMIQGDPGGWSDVGGSLSALATRLETGVSDADSFGAQALARSWTGPAAAAFSAHWATRCPRYEDLIVLVRRAARAILAYAQTLEDMRARAANLESVWCGVGLHVLYSGEGFMLPAGLESMPPHAQVSLRQALSESARDVESLGADCVAAATDLAAVLGSVIAALEEFTFLSLGGSPASEFGRDFQKQIKGWESDVNDTLGLGSETLTYIANRSRGAASQLGHDLRTGDELVRSHAAPLLRPVGEKAARLDDLAKGAGHVATGIGWFFIAGDVIYDTRVRHESLLASIEDNSGDIVAQLVSDAAVAAAGAVIVAAVATAPAAVVVVGAVVIGGVVAAGVGAGVQMVVDHNRQRINNFVHKAGQDLQGIAPGLEAAF